MARWGTGLIGKYLYKKYWKHILIQLDFDISNSILLVVSMPAICWWVAPWWASHWGSRSGWWLERLKIHTYTQLQTLDTGRTGWWIEHKGELNPSKATSDWTPTVLTCRQPFSIKIYSVHYPTYYTPFTSTLIDILIKSCTNTNSKTKTSRKGLPVATVLYDSRWWLLMAFDNLKVMI